ncbi:MAG: YebC/PmpR family DNA-binding transcriptional regulator [Chloroflexi bacterium]|nr:YebC/PmpR family DNA-binding transcriptional regulator [Chloroflexota bacterium]
MSGHSKWAQIKRQKGVADTRRGQLFTKLGREISVAARQGGGDPEANFRLRLAIQKARDNNMPMENIERAVKRGAGGAEAAALIEATYEGYGPGGIAVLVHALTDNRNRTVADVRNLFTRGGGNMAEAGSVSWLFDAKGVIAVEGEGADTEELALYAIDAGAEDVKMEDSTLEIYTRPEELEVVRRALDWKKAKVVSAEVSMVPKTLLTVSDEKTATQALRFLDKLEELDDVQRVYTNADFPAEMLEKLQGAA